MKTYILGTVLALGIVISPAFTHAAGLTSSQIQSILSILSSFGVDQSVISNVQVALNGGTPTNTTSQFCYNFNSNLSMGQNGSAVIALQTALQKDGESVSITSTFDEQTASAVTGFQEKYISDILTPVGLNHGTGYVGVSTRAKLNSLYGCSLPSTQLLNAVVTPTISRVSPTSVVAGNIVTIYGTNFQPKSRIDIGNNLTAADYRTVYPSSYVDNTAMSFVLPVDMGIGTYVLRVDGSKGLATLNVISDPASILAPTISSAGEFGMYDLGKNIMSRGGQAFVYGKGLLENSTVTIVIGNYSVSGKIDSGTNEAIFFVPDIPSGNYNLYIVTSSGFKTNSITVTVL